MVHTISRYIQMIAIILFQKLCSLLQHIDPCKWHNICEGRKTLLQVILTCAKTQCLKGWSSHDYIGNMHYVQAHQSKFAESAKFVQIAILRCNAS